MHHKKPRVLFVLRQRDDYWGQTNPNTYNSSGLLNSAKFVCDMLISASFSASLAQVNDGNGIDAAVYKFKPDIVVLEAIWCPPYKLRELVSIPRYKHITWIVRNHSELSFLGFEGIAVQWLLEYATIPNVILSCNSSTAREEVKKIIEIRSGEEEIVLDLPNYYPTRDAVTKEFFESDTVDIGCFGAIRPLKNQLEQAVAAIIFADEADKSLRFHINSSRIEGNAQPILKSIRALFSGSANAELIEEPWMERSAFLNLCGEMDIGMQVSFSETFNIVTADLITQGTPVICSDEVPWMPSEFHADPSSALDIAKKLGEVYGQSVHRELHALREYSEHSKHLWISTLCELYNSA